LVIAGARCGQAVAAAPARQPTSRTVPVAIAVALLAAGPGVHAATTIREDVPNVRAAAQAWDGRDTQIRAAHADGQTSVTVAAIHPPPDLGDFEDTGLRGCASTAYGLTVAVR
jgi:hypothetical protein